MFLFLEISVGYDYSVKAYRLWDPTSRKIVISRDVTFDESSLFKSNVERVEQKKVSLGQQIQLEIVPFPESRKEGLRGKEEHQKGMKTLLHHLH